MSYSTPHGRPSTTPPEESDAEPLPEGPVAMEGVEETFEEEVAMLAQLAQENYMACEKYVGNDNEWQ